MIQTAASDGPAVGAPAPTGTRGVARILGRSARRCLNLALVFAAGTLACHDAVAEVVLSTQVQKVETLLNAAGNVERRLTPADAVQEGDELRYTITVRNNSEVLVTEGRVVVTNPVPRGTHYVVGSAGGADCLVEFSSDGQTFAASEADLEGRDAQDQPGEVRSIRWTLERDLAPGATHDLFFHVRMGPDRAL